MCCIHSRDPTPTPPTTPQCHRNAEHEWEQDAHVMGSPQHCHIPHPQHNIGGPIPFQLNIPQGYVPPPPLDNPFQTVQYGNQELHLTQGIAAQLHNLPLLHERQGRGRALRANQLPVG